MPAPEAGATPRTPLAWVRRAACLLLLALTASLPLAGPAQAQSDSPDPVTDLTPTPGNGQITLRWDASEGATGYRIRYHAVGYASIPLFPVDVTDTRHTLTGLLNNVEYVFDVSAMNGSGQESDPATVNAIPVEDGVEATPPSQIGYVLLQAGDGQITASWAEAADNGGQPVTGYLVEYRAGGGSWQTWPHGSAATTTTITGLQGDVSYAVRVSATNAAGTGPASAPEYATPEQPPEPTAPSQVTGLRLTAGDAQITASWNAPPDGGFPLTGYRVEYQAGSGSWQQWTHTGTGRNATLTGLTNDTSYGVRVSAINAIGTGPASAVRRATPTAPSQPSVPGKPVVTLTPGNTQIEVEWTEPANNGAAITDYDVRYRAGTSGGWTDKPHTGTTRNTTITSLTNGQSYQVQVQAKNSAGSGPWSDAATATPQPSVSVPGQPDAPTLTAGNTQIEVEWTAPANNGAAITDYDVEYRQGSSGNYTDWPHSGTTLNTTITGLTNDQSYEVRVRASNSAGAGPWSDAATATPTASPSAPDKPVVTLTPGNAEIEVEWTAPANNGAAITDYDVQYRQGTSGGWTDKPHTGTTRSTTIESLTNGQSYQVQVRATNSAGPGAWSDAVTATPRTVPGKPAVTLTAGDTQITANWPEPDTNGAAITDYDVEYRQGTSGNFTNWPHTGTARTATITGLTNDQSYQVQVRATNAAGSGAWSTLKQATPAAKSLVLSETSHTVLENGGTATWTVALSAQPSADVTVSVTSGNTSDATVSPASLTFTSSNWQTAQDVTVTGVDDTSQNTDNKRDVTITHTAASTGDSGYNGKTATVAVAVADDETATVTGAIWSAVMVAGADNTSTGYQQTPSFGALSQTTLSDAGSTYTVTTFIHTYVPIANINWLSFDLNSSRLRTGLEPLWLQINGTIYKLPWNSSVTAYRITDGPTSSLFTEDGIYEVHVIDPTPQDVAAAPGDTKLTVTWTNADGADSHSVRHRVSSPAGSWTTANNKASGYEITGLTNNTEYDVQIGAVFGSDTYWSATVKGTPGGKSLVFSKTSHTVLENGGTATWTVALSAQPSADVAVTVTSGNTSDATVSPASITFTSSNWETAQDVTVTGVDDTSQNTDNKRDVTITHTASSDDDDYDQTATVAVAVADDETETVADAIWSAVMVPGSYVSGGATAFGYSTNAGALSSNAITVGGSSYTVSVLAWSSANNTVQFFTSLPGAGNRLPTRLEPLRLRIDGTIYKLPWNSASSLYTLAGVTSNPFPEDAIREIHLIDPTPKNVAVAAGNAKLTVTWTDAGGADSHSVRHRVSSPAGSWTTATNKASGYEITSLTNNTEYDVQVGAVFGSDTWWSDTVKATPTVQSVGMALLDAQMTVGLSGAAKGYNKGVFGSISPATPSFTYKGSTYELTWLSHYNSTFLATNPEISLARLNELKITWNDHSYSGGWEQVAAGRRDHSTVPTGLAEDDVVNVVIEIPTTGGPSAPGGFTATAGSSSATLAWSDPSDSSITKWQYRYKTSGAYSAWTDVPSSSATTTSHTVTGLNNGIAYTFQVRASYTATPGSASVERAVTPGEPPSGFAATGGNAEVELTWTGPTDSSITGWEFRYKSTGAYNNWAAITLDSGDTCHTTANTTCSHTVGSLANNTEYTFQIRAVYGSAKGLASSEEKATPTADLRNFEVHPGNALAKLFWDELAGADSYSVRYKVSTTNSWTTLTGQTSPVEISSLTNATEYDFQAGVVDGGSTNWTSTTKATPASGLPGVLAFSFIHRLEPTIVRVDWASGTMNNYIVEHRLVSASSWTQTHEDASTNFAVTITGLTAGEDYLIRVRGKTAAGTSADPGPATDPILFNAAKSPGNITRARGDTKFTVTWNDVTGASSYSVRHSLSGSSFGWTTATDKSSGYEITGLTNGTNYFVQVGAVVGGKTYWSGVGGNVVVPGLPIRPHSNLAAQPRDGGLYATWTHGSVKAGALPIVNFWYRQGTTGSWTYYSGCDTPGDAEPLSEQDCNVTGLTNGTVYQVRVYSGGSGWDEIVATGTPGPAPSAVTVNAASATSLSIAWTDATGAVGHRLRHRATTATNDGEWTVVTSPANPYTLSSLTADTEYDIQVGADHGTSDGTSTPACDGKDACGTNWSAVLKATPSNKRLVISETSRTVLEKQGTATWTVALNEAPSADVKVKVSTGDNAVAKLQEGTSGTPADEVELTFTSTDYAAKTITVTGQNDPENNPANMRDVTITHTAESTGDTTYDGKTGYVGVRVVDDETALVENSFLSAVMVAGTRPFGGNTDVGYASNMGQITSDSLSAQASGFTMNSLYIRDTFGRLTMYVTKPATPFPETRLPSPLDEGFVLQLGSGSSATRVRMDWISTGSYYYGPANSNVSFTDGEIYEVHLIAPGPAKPTGFTATAGNSSAALAWTGPTDDAIEKWQYRYKTSGNYGEWTDIPGSDKDTRDYTVTGLTDGTAYTFQVRAFSTSGVGGEASDEAAVTPGSTEIWSATLTAGASGDQVGYRSGEFGSVTDDDFVIDGTTYTVSRFVYDDDAGEGHFYVGGQRLPQSLEANVKVGIGDNDYALVWYSPRSRYYLDGLTTSPFVSGTTYNVALVAELVPTKPENFTATAGYASVALAWTGPADDTITKWQVRQKAGTGNYGNWTDIASSDKDTRNHTVSSLTNGTTYTFQVRGVNSAGNGAASNERTATPDAGGDILLDANMTAAVNPNDSEFVGYYNHPNANLAYGSIDDNTFSYDGTDYTLFTVVAKNVTDGFIRFTTTSAATLTLAQVNALQITVGDKVYHGGWSSETSGFEQDLDGLSLANGDMVAVRIVAPAADAPTGFTATPSGENGVALAWTDPSNSDITKWQYRVKAHGGSYGNWTDMSGSGASTTSHTLDGLASHTPHTFQVRAYTTAAGLASDEKTTKPGGLQVLMSTKITVGVDGNWRGYHFGDSGFGTIDDETVYYQKPGETDYTKFRLSWVYQDGDDRVCIAFNTNINRADFQNWVVSVKDKRYLGGWVSYNNATCQVAHTLDGLNLVDGERVAVTLSKPVTGEVNDPTGFSASAGDASVALAWTGPADNSITKWQWRQRTATGDYGPWFNVPNSNKDTLKHTVTNLTNETPYRFQTRAFSTLPGIPSVELSATPPYLLETTLTAKSSSDKLGYEHGSYGSIGDRTFSYGGTTYTLNLLYEEDDRTYFQTSPQTPLATLNALRITVGGATYQGGWSVDGTEHEHDDTPGWHPGDTVAVKIKAGIGATAEGAAASTPLVAPTGVTAEGGEGAATVSWQMPEAAGIASAPRGNAAGGGTLTQLSQSAPPTAAGPAADGPAGSGGPADSGGTAANGGASSSASAASAAETAAAGASEYEVAWTLAGEDWSAGGAVLVTDLTATIPELANGTRYLFRVRAWSGAEPGPWSETVATVPGTAATLVEPFPDLELANAAVYAIDLRAHFSGTGLTYEVRVTTTDQDTGEAGTAPINTVAREKVTGAWAGDVLTLTAGPSGHHVLGMEVIATDLAGGTARDDFQLTVGTSSAESLAREALQNTLASRARSMLEEASSTIVGRMKSGGPGTDALGAFAGLFGVGRSAGACPLEESLEECMKRDASGDDAPLFGAPDGSGDAFGPLAFDWNREDEGLRAIDLSEFRDRVRAQGFAVSLNQPLAPASSADGLDGAQGPPDAPVPEAGMQLTFWGRGSAASGSSDALFWGLDASMGEHWMTGLAFAESGGEVSQSLSRSEASVSGLATSEISAVYPYIRSRFDSGLDVWSLMGWGSGRVDSTWTGVSHAGSASLGLNGGPGWPDSKGLSQGAGWAAGSEETIDLDGEVAFDLGLVGAEQRLYEAGGFSLSALGDAGWSRLAVTSGTAEGIEATVSRTRLGLEGRYVSEDGDFSSTLRAGARVDGGDGQTASGTELMGGVRRTWGRWLAGVTGRWYAADTAGIDFGAQGVRATLGLASREDGTGLGLTLSPGWGTQAEASKQDGLLAALDGSSAGQEPAAHLDGRVSWGMKLPGQGLYAPGERLSTYAELSVAEEGAGHLQTGLALETRLPGAGLLAGRLTPHAELRLDQGGARHLRAGLAFEGPVTLTLAADRQETGSGPATHAILLRLDTSF